MLAICNILFKQNECSKYILFWKWVKYAQGVSFTRVKKEIINIIKTNEKKKNLKKSYWTRVRVRGKSDSNNKKQMITNKQKQQDKNIMKLIKKASEKNTAKG